ncbi:hypothetical protein C2S53_009854 [Perilla frutescens var. hirtella]|uniref:Uncharacterized protein n=1 Tax=Perilla frutescens var. hirtella TaxID=608512 RepID=A0AAD4JPE5_PERFH|nr:hypothetical protein C2S53_009854 [Perilla frutescens var. hirtella]
MDFKSFFSALNGTQRSVDPEKNRTERPLEASGRWEGEDIYSRLGQAQRPLECHHRQSQRPLGSGDGWGARFQLLTGRWDTALAGFFKFIKISCPEVGFHPL